MTKDQLFAECIHLTCECIRKADSMESLSHENISNFLLGLYHNLQEVVDEEATDDER